MSMYDYDPKEVKQWWLNTPDKISFMRKIGILNRDYRALKRAMAYYNLSLEEMGDNL